MEKNKTVHQKVKQRAAIWPDSGISLLGITPYRNENISLHKDMNVDISIIQESKNGNNINVHHLRSELKKHVIYPYNIVLLGSKKEWST